MTKKKKRKDIGEDLLKKEAVHTIFSIALLALGVFFILASMGLAGLAGSKSFEWLFTFFGIGYFLFPLLFFIVSASLLKSLDIPFNSVRIISVLVFFLSALAIIEISLLEGGGIAGEFVSRPLMYLFDSYASLVLLWALVLISLIALFNERPSLESIAFWKRFKKEGFDENDLSLSESEYEKIEEEEIDETEDDESNDAEEEEDEDSVKKEADKEGGVFADLFGGKKKSFSLELDQDYAAPPISLLEKRSGRPDVGDIKANANIIKRTLANFGISVEMDEVSIGPSFTRYALKPAEGVKLSKILALQNNLEYALASHPVRIEAPIPGKSLVGIEVPNAAKTTVGIASILSSKEFTESKRPLTVGLGRGISGMTYVASISKMPHLLIAGATGAGKSVTIHAIITSLLYRHSPAELKLMMIDPKRVELTLYNGIPHLLTPVITDAKKAILALKWATQEMERRYNILEEHKVRDIASYHENFAGKISEGDEDSPALPYIVVIVDELADIMQSYPRELESVIVRLAQMSRAVGIHLILSTQRPSVNVITGLIKANIPTRIALQVASQIDSRTILDTSGAEKLLGAGDMLYLSADMSKPIRIQSAFISEEEVKKVAKHLKRSYEYELPSDVVITDGNDSSTGEIFDSLSDDDEDDLYEEARDAVIRAGKASTSYLQRKLRVGYSRAARLVDILEERGVVGPQDGSKPREILVEKPGDQYEDETGEES